MLDLSIIILNYNTQDWLRNCLQSIDDFPPKKISGEIIVVDNASSDGSPEMVKSEFPRVRLIQSKENGGFAKGNNLGITQAKGRYIMLLNSDAEFTVRTDLDSLIQYMDEHDNVGVITPRVELPDGALDMASHRGEPTIWASLSYFAKLEEKFPESKLFGQYHQTWKKIDTVHEIEACSGAAMMVRASALKKVGLLDDQFFMYAEDLDWCRRFREAGFTIVFYPHSVVIHHKYKSGRGKKEKPKGKPLNTHLDIPGFDIPNTKVDAPKTNNAEHHFWETMNLYYQKHYGNQPLKKFLVSQGVALMKRVKGKR